MPGVLNDQSCSPVKRNPQSPSNRVRKPSLASKAAFYGRIPGVKERIGSSAVEDAIPVGKCMHESGFRPPVERGSTSSPCMTKKVIEDVFDGLPALRGSLAFLGNRGLESAAKPSISTSSGDKLPATSPSWVVAANSYPLSSRMHPAMCWRSTEVRRLCDGNRNTERDRRSASGQSPR
jgi:hypothetical protein